MPYRSFSDSLSLIAVGRWGLEIQLPLLPLRGRPPLHPQPDASGDDGVGRLRLRRYVAVVASCHRRGWVSPSWSQADGASIRGRRVGHPHQPLVSESSALVLSVVSCAAPIPPP
jgi:hypothetical protein